MSERDAVVIRRVSAADSKALALFFEDNDRVETRRYFHPFPLTAESASHIALNTHLDRFYIALLNQQVVGLCMLRGWDEGFVVPSFGVLVDHRHQGVGLGRRLTEFAIDEAKTLDCRSLRLSVYASNVHAVRLYTSLSFRVVHHEPFVVAGRTEEKISMVREL